MAFDRAKLAAVLGRHEDAEGTGIYDNPALGGLLTWEDNWPPERWGEWLQQVKVAKKFVQRTLRAAQKLWAAEGAELRRGQAIAEARSGKLAAILDLIFIPDKPIRSRASVGGYSARPRRRRRPMKAGFGNIAVRPKDAQSGAGGAGAAGGRAAKGGAAEGRSSERADVHGLLQNGDKLAC